jgi:hypothetical protein
MTTGAYVKTPGLSPDDPNAINHNAFNATPGGDFQVVSGRLDWGDGDEGDRKITVTIIDDRVPETVELFGIGTSDPQGNALAIGTSVDVAIVDDDPAASPTTPAPPSPRPSVSGSAGSGGGGGALSWSTLLTILSLQLARRRRPPRGLFDTQA